MTQGEKQLLLKTLCSMLPYGVKVRISSESDCCLYVNTTTLDIDNLHKYMLDGGYYKRGLFYKTPNFQLLPYLRPMSSMTEEEENEYRAINCYEGLFPRNEDALDYVLSHHLDFRGLIEKGLAIDAPEDMYKTE